MSVSLPAKPGSRERLKVRSRCGCNLWARQMRCTEPTEMPMALAIARPVQWVASCGGWVQVSATTCAAVSAANARSLNVLARPVAVGGDRCQLLALGGAQYHTYPLCHGPIPPPAMAQYCTSSPAGESYE